MAKARHALETVNYTVEKVLLLQRGDALAGCAVLVVGGPKIALLPREIDAVRAYLAKGGNALFMLDPFVRTGLEPVIREYGVVVDDDIVIDEASHFWADVSSPAVTDYNRHQITRDLPLTFFPGARSLSPTPQRVPGTSVVPLVNSSKNSWGQADPNRVGFVKGRDAPGPNTLMVVALRRPGEESTPRSRIAVVGDSDFATNSFFRIMGNCTLFLNTVNYLAAQENLIGLQPRTADLPRVNLTNRQMKGTFFLSVVLVPALLAVVGTAVWWKQHSAEADRGAVWWPCGWCWRCWSWRSWRSNTRTAAGRRRAPWRPTRAGSCPFRSSSWARSRSPTPGGCIASSGTRTARGSITAFTREPRAATRTPPIPRSRRASSARSRLSAGRASSGSSPSTATGPPTASPRRRSSSSSIGRSRPSRSRSTRSATSPRTRPVAT